MIHLSILRVFRDILGEWKRNGNDYVRGDYIGFRVQSHFFCKGHESSHVLEAFTRNSRLFSCWGSSEPRRIPGKFWEKSRRGAHKGKGPSLSGEARMAGGGRLFVGNLPPDVTEDQLQYVLTPARVMPCHVSYQI